MLGNALLDIKIRPFLDKKEQLHSLFKCYLPIYQFYYRFERFSNTNFFIGELAPPCPLAMPLLICSLYFEAPTLGLKSISNSTFFMLSLFGAHCFSCSF